MESFGMKDGSQQQQQQQNNKKAATTTFGLIRRGNASDMEKMKPHFFRVMLDFMLKDAKIYIPTEFVKKNGSRLVGAASVTLKDANGDTWEVELATDGEGLIWLVEGWEDITKHHSLKQGDILVFRLEQDNSFHVMVFEPTASEKKKCGRRRSSKDVINGHGTRPLNDVKAEEEVSAGKLKQKKKGKEKLGSPLKHVPTPPPPSNRESKTVILGMPGPSSAGNPNFSVTISEDHMKRGYIRVPTRFVFEHMLLGDGTMPEKRAVMVCAEDGFDSWRLSFVFRPRGDGGSRQGAFIGGWPAFSRENYLKPGDVCRFELVPDGQMKVTVLHN